MFKYGIIPSNNIVKCFMNITKSIDAMLEEIRNYSGNFGDPIVDLIDFNPLEILASGNPESSVGAGIALLVNFSNHVDNATYQDAKLGKAALEIQSAITSGYCSGKVTLFNAFKSALVSETAYNQALKEVYFEYVQ